MEERDIKKAEEALTEWNSNPESTMCGNEYIETALYALNVVKKMYAEVARLDNRVKEHSEIASTTVSFEERRENLRLSSICASEKSHLEDLLSD